MDSFSADDEIIILTDLLGGRINNDMMRFLNDRRVHLVSGMNLGLVLQLYMYENEKIEEAIIEAIKDAKEGIQYCSDLDTFMEMDRFLGEDE